VRNVRAVGTGYLASLLRRRTAASFALLVLVLVDEIEALVFVGLGVALQRFDLFVELQSALFPAALFVAAAASIARHSHQRRVREREREELIVLARRIGSLP